MSKQSGRDSNEWNTEAVIQSPNLMPRLFWEKDQRPESFEENDVISHPNILDPADQDICTILEMLANSHTILYDKQVRVQSVLSMQFAGNFSLLPPMLHDESELRNMFGGMDAELCNKLTQDSHPATSQSTEMEHLEDVAGELNVEDINAAHELLAKSRATTHTQHKIQSMPSDLETLTDFNNLTSLSASFFVSQMLHDESKLAHKISGNDTELRNKLTQDSHPATSQSTEMEYLEDVAGELDTASKNKGCAGALLIVLLVGIGNLL